ncbi:hypothetical protein P1P91_01980 [Halomonas piscis]|uniref:Uncharacterized protein n=1 Tax=Halomonas piscis TaxID=3031727 RepID=A0ABY9Z198_9GAMM|nr:hypothetical protein [Halomonas piscis]WNK20480.1 hypothetical protein P1P91_01980 [Halomonas piscis]
MRLFPYAKKQSVLAILAAGALSLGGIGLAGADEQAGFDSADDQGAMEQPSGQDDQISNSRPEPPADAGQGAPPAMSDDDAGDPQGDQDGLPGSYDEPDSEAESGQPGGAEQGEGEEAAW